MRVAVYAIAKNEEQFVTRWVESALEADCLILLDTGSTDNTVALAESLGVTVGTRTYDPWRFDDARNDSLALIPDDIDLCVALDLDEQLQPGWRQHLEQAYEDGVNRPRYQYTWSWEGTRPGLVYGGDKIHSRHDFYWKHPVHEVLTPLPGHEEHQGWYGLEIHHHPDATKSRGSYLPLLALAVEEDPDDDRNAHYYARELYFAGRNAEAAEEFKRHLALPRAVWPPERAASWRYLAKIDPDNAAEYLTHACAEAPESREPWIDMAQLGYRLGDWLLCLHSALAALNIKTRPLAYLNDPQAWGPLPHDLAAIAAHHLGYRHEALYHGTQAVRLNPYETRLSMNLNHYREAAA